MMYILNSVEHGFFSDENKIDSTLYYIARMWVGEKDKINRYDAGTHYIRIPTYIARKNINTASSIYKK